MSESKPLISVVVPCLNRAKYLRPTIDSVLAQDYEAIECIVVDGGSTDGSVDILHSYGDRIRWTSEPDNGHAHAINKGWKSGRGEILAWLNADDVWDAPGAAARAIDLFAEHRDADVIYGDCGAIDDKGRVIGESYLHDWDLQYAVEHCDHCIPQPAAFVRRSIAEKVGWLDETLISKKDHEFWLRIGLTGTIKYVPGVLAHERTGPGYLAERGDITARACIALTEKFFSQPNVPSEIRDRRKRALSNAYLKGGEYAWNQGRHLLMAIGYLLRSTLTDLSNWRAASRYLTMLLKTDLVRLRDRARKDRHVHTD